MPPISAETRHVLKRQVPQAVTSRILFSDSDAVEWPQSVSLFLARDLWDDLGRPEEVTIGIRPGDRLNDEQDDTQPVRDPARPSRKPGVPGPYSSSGGRLF